MGSSVAHPRESPEWRAMDLPAKIDFFAAIWRVMRDDNMSLQDVSRSAAVRTLIAVAGQWQPGPSRESTFRRLIAG